MAMPSSTVMSKVAICCMTSSIWLLSEVASEWGDPDPEPTKSREATPKKV